jgi:hypothetical protein
MSFSSISLVVVSLFPLVAHVHGHPSVIEPATQLVKETTAAGVPLHKSESYQLTDAIVKRISEDSQTSHIAHLFAFDDGKRSKRQQTECKTFPGDQEWPSKKGWDDFNQLLGGALIPTIPIGAPCYDSEWGPKNLTKCNEIISSYGTPSTQYVLSGYDFL